MLHLDRGKESQEQRHLSNQSHSEGREETIKKSCYNLSTTQLIVCLTYLCGVLSTTSRLS